MLIDAHTKIAALIKHDPRALDAIVNLSPGFEKLRNPILRKLMAGRTSIAMAAKIGGCSTEDFFAVLRPLGFETGEPMEKPEEEARPLPAFLQKVSREQIVDLDVRPALASGNDPLQMIMKTVKELKSGQVLKVINTFEPTPLMNLLKKQGFESYADHIDVKLVETYFFKVQPGEVQEITLPEQELSGWEQTLKRFEHKLHHIDVRHMEMPMPMMTILEELEKLPEDRALYVYHKRIPVFLLTELKERHFDFRINEISDGEVHLIIFKS